MTYHGIMRTREYTVKYGDKDEEADQRINLAQDSRPLRGSGESIFKSKN